MSLRDYFTQSLKKDEAVIVVVRKHWVTIAAPMALALVVLGVLIGFIDVFFSSSVGAYAWFGIVLIVLFYVLYHWIMYYFDSFIITDLRIIDIDQHGLFKRTVSETTFDRVQDVTYSIIGMVATTLNFGTVNVATASATTKIELDHVPHPRKVHEIILEAQRVFKTKHPDMSAKELIELIAQVKPKNDARDTEAQDEGPQSDDEEAEA